MSGAAVEAVVTARTAAIIPVHLYGQAAPVERLMPLARRAGAWLVENAAQLRGARRKGASAGALGDAAASFYPGKSLGAYGDAGAALTGSADVAARDRVLKELHAASIGAGIHYLVPIHLTAAFNGLGYRQGTFPVAEYAARELLSLPLFPEITVAQQERVVSVLISAL